LCSLLFIYIHLLQCYEHRHFLFIELNKSSRTFHSDHKIYWYHRKDLFWPHQNWRYRPSMEVMNDKLFLGFLVQC
jgi:hypothetical protein